MTSQGFLGQRVFFTSNLREGSCRKMKNSPVDEEVKEEEETLVPQPEVVFVKEEEETLVPQPKFVEEEVENPATPMPEASPTSPEEEEAPHLPDAPPARILRHVDHIELMLDVMGLDGLFRNNPSSHWMRCLTTKFRHLAKKLHPDKPGGSAAQMEELKYAYDYFIHQSKRIFFVGIFCSDRETTSVFSP